MKTYSGYRDDSSLLESSSGGAASALAESFVQNGGVVFGTAYASDFKSAEMIKADNMDTLSKLRGSKYVETRKNFTEVLGSLSECKTVLVFGLGCDIGALRALLKKKDIDDSHLYTVDILCHGPSSTDVLRGYIEDLERKYHAKIKAFHVRYKKEGWTPPYVRAEFENGKIYEEVFEFTDYGYAFNKYALPRCTKCHFKGEQHTGDLCLGDYWGVEKSDTGYNPNGVSLIIVQTEKGQQLLSMLSSGFKLQEIDFNNAISHNPAYYQCREQGTDYNLFSEAIKQKSLHETLLLLPEYRKWKRSVRVIKAKRKMLKMIGK